MVNRPLMLRRVCMMAALAAPSLVSAQENPVLDAQGFRPSPSPHAIFGVDAADTSEALEPALGVWLNYASAPLVAKKASSDAIEPVVDQQLTLHLTGALGIARRAELGFDMPLLMVNNGSFNDIAFGGVVPGDLSARLKGSAFSSRDHGVGLAGLVELRLPTGDDGVFASNGGALGAPALIVDARLGPAIIAANAGLALRSSRQVRNIRYGSDITYGLAARVELLDALLSLDASLQGRTQLRSPFEDEATSPVEALVGVRLKTPAGLIISMGGGGGIVSGVTAAEFRAVVSVGWAAALAAEPDAIALSAAADAPDEPALADPVDPADTTDAPPDAPREPAPDTPADPPKQPAPATQDVARVESGAIVFKSGELGFKFGSATLRDTSPPLLDAVAALLNAQPELKIEIGVHTDTLGDPDENIALSQKQADVVRAELIKRGVAAERLSAKGYGGEQPIIAEEQTAEDEETNRRVELKVTP